MIKMTYQAYVQRIQRIAVVYHAIRKFRVPILTLLITLVLSSSAYLVAKGMIIGSPTCTETISYGDVIECQSKVLLGEAYYEYTSADTENWSTTVPKLPGNYFMRAVSVRSFGIVSHSKPVAFTIEKLYSELTVAESEIEYGDMPTAAASNLAPGDSIVKNSVSFEIDNYAINPTHVKLVAGSVKIVNKNGDDVTAAYDIHFVDEKKDINIVPRSVTVQIDGAEKIYDGAPLSYGDWTIIDGDLLGDDFLSVEINASQTESGTLTGSSVIEAGGILATVQNPDVEGNIAYYDINFVAGDLVVKPCPITVTTADGEHVYDGKLFSVSDQYTVDSEYPLPEGFTLTVLESSSIADVGETENVFTSWTITLADGTDISKNFEISYKSGILRVTPRPLALQTGSGEKVYDATALSVPSATPMYDGELLFGHRVEVLASFEGINVGVYENTATEIRIMADDGSEEGKDVTANYTVSVESYGTLTITKRPIILSSGDKTWEYDGLDHVFDGQGTLTEGTLPEGHTIAYHMNATVKYVGDSPVRNTFTVTVTDATSTDVTENYDIVCSYGSLSVTPRKIDIMCNGSKIYDATPLQSDVVEFLYDRGLVADDQIFVTADGSIVECGTTSNHIISCFILNGDKDVTDCYDIVLHEGTLEILKRKVALVSSAREMYNDQEWTCKAYTVLTTENDFVEGHYAELETSAHRTDVGKVDNRILSHRIWDASGYEVTHNYEIIYEVGSLEVYPCPITVQAGSKCEMYNGQPLRADSCVLHESSPYEFWGSDYIMVEDSTSLTEVGTADNIILKYHIYDAEGNDHTANYEVTVLPGKLEVTKRPVTIVTYDDHKVYDAEPLYCVDFNYIINEPNGQYALVASHRLDVISSAHVTTVSEGYVENQFYEWDILDSDGNSVRKNYEVTFQNGQLYIEKRPVTLQLHDGERVYDDTPLIQPEHTPIGLVAGHTSYIPDDILPSITYVGKISNKIADDDMDAIEIYDENGAKVTENYLVSCESGTLKITPRPVLAQLADASLIYNGDFQWSHAYEIHADSPYGFVLGHKVTIEESTKLMNVGTYPNEVLGAGAVVHDANGREVTENYIITWLPGQLTIEKRPVVIVPEGAEFIYNGEPHVHTDYTVYTDALNPYGFVKDHLLKVISSRVVVNVWDSCQNYFDEYLVVSELQGDVTENYEIIIDTERSGMLTVLPRLVEIYTNSRQAIYNGLPIYEDGFRVGEPTEDTGLLTNHHIIDWQYPSFVDAGVYSNRLTDFVITSNAGEDMSANYDVQCFDGTVTVLPRPITIVTASGHKVYDGSPLTLTGYDNLFMTGEDDGYGVIVQGQVLFISESNSITNVGEIDNILSGVSIISEIDGEDKTHNYEISYVYGKLKITPREIIVITPDDSKVYDGLPLVNSGIEIAGDGMADGERFIPLTTTFMTDCVLNGFGEVISVPNEVLVYEIRNAAERLIDPNNYEISYQYGSLKIDQREVTVSVSAEKTYDGKPIDESHLTIEDLELPNALLDQHYVIIVPGNTRINAGEETVTVASYVVMTQSGQDVTVNYDVHIECGMLEITKAVISITSNARKPYDGMPLTCTKPEYTGYLCDGHQIILVTEGSQTEVGISVNKVLSATIMDTYTGQNVTENYEIELVDGILEVQETAFVITSESAEKMYDGLPLTYHEYVITGASLPDGYTYEILFDGNRTTVGSASNTFTYKILDPNGKDVSDQFLVKCNYGTLTVLSPELTFTPHTISMTYDGKPHGPTGNEYYYTGMLPDGFSITDVVFTEQKIYVGKYQAEILSVVIRDAQGKDVTDQFTCIFKAVALEITRNHIIIRTKDASRYYTGMPLTANTANDWWLSESILPSGHRVVVVITGKITAPGSVANSIDDPIIYNEAGEDVTDQFEIEKQLGTLTILKY